MPKQLLKLEAAQPGEVCAGFLLVKKEHVASNGAELYTLRHEKTGAELLYFDARTKTAPSPSASRPCRRTTRACSTFSSTAS